jgi:(2Fe-2S) ferredoxin
MGHIVPKKLLSPKECAAFLKIQKCTKHIFLCTGPHCCNQDQGDLVWQKLKEHCSKLQDTGIHFNRTKVNCLRICNEGPIALVYPEGVWLKNVDLENLDRVIDSLIQDKSLADDHQNFAKSDLILNSLNHTKT